MTELWDYIHSDCSWNPPSQQTASYTHQDYDNHDNQECRKNKK